MSSEKPNPPIPNVHIATPIENDRPFVQRLERLLFGRYQPRSLDEAAWRELEREGTPAELRRRIREEHLRECMGLIVLIGADTWRLRRVDWEISAGIRIRYDEPHKALLGLLLPTHPDFGRPSYDLGRIPPRLYENIVATYARLADWTDDPEALVGLIEDAETRAVNELPVNTWPHLTQDFSGDRWKRLPPGT